VCPVSGEPTVARGGAQGELVLGILLWVDCVGESGDEGRQDARAATWRSEYSMF
jgi:hypothetical protein